MIKTMYKLIYEMLSKKVLLLLLIVCSFSVRESLASHAAGSDLTYQALGNNQYLVTFTFYRDCFGIDPPFSQTLNVSSATCNVTLPAFTMDTVPDAFPGIGVEITTNCSTVVSTCDGGSATGIQQCTYSTIVTLPANCADWQFSTSVSARNQAVTTFDNPSSDNLYCEAYLNNTAGDNSSPVFTNVPIAFECIGQPNNFNQGAIDADGDSLVYSFIAPRTDPNTPLTYSSGYSVTNPFISNPPVSINDVTGDIFMQPTQPDITIMAIQVQEYRNGVLIGTVMRDMQLYAVQCANILPDLGGIDTTSNFSTTSCVGGQLCFNVLSNDPDPNQILTMSWNQGVPGATFTVSGSPHPTGQFCWTPTQADARPQPYTFTVNVRDDACPANGSVTKSYSITVSNMSLSLTSTPSVSCSNSHNGSAMATTTGNPPLTYTWTLPTSPFIITGTSSINHLDPGNYSLNVTDGNNCVGVSNFSILAPPPLVVNVTGVNSGCGGGGGSGSATANVTGGTPGTNGYSYLWNTSPTQTTQTATNLATNTYLVQVKDANNCQTTGSVNIVAVVPVTFAISSTPANCVANNGTVTVTHQGGTGPFSYVWTPDIPQNTTTSALTNLITGQYSVVVTDIGGGCSDSLSTLVNNTAGISASIVSQSDATCETGENGVATVMATGGQLPYTYLWPNGVVTPTDSTLAPGTHLVKVTDYNGCNAYASVTIGFVNASPALDFGPDSVACTSGGPVTLDAGPGMVSYLWSDNTALQTLIVNPPGGTYSCLITDSNGCERSDAIDVTFSNCLIHNGSFRSTNGGKLNIYPNPANNELNVQIYSIRDTEVKVTLNDILGNTVYTKTETAEYSYSKKIDIHSLSQGVYLLKVEYNGEITTSRIVKQ